MVFYIWYNYLTKASLYLNIFSCILILLPMKEEPLHFALTRVMLNLWFRVLWCNGCWLRAILSCDQARAIEPTLLQGSAPISISLYCYIRMHTQPNSTHLASLALCLIMILIILLVWALLPVDPPIHVVLIMIWLVGKIDLWYSWTNNTEI